VWRAGRSNIIQVESLPEKKSHFYCLPGRSEGYPVALGAWDPSELVFRSVWTFLDPIAWASGGVGLAVLLVMGIVAAVVALRRIEALSGKGRGGLEDG